MLYTVRLGDITRWKELLASGADVNQADSDGFTALIRAAYWSRYSLAQFLLVEGEASIDQGTTGIWGLLNGTNIWGVLGERKHTTGDDDSREFPALLKVMVMLSDAPQFFISELLPHDADFCTRGGLLRAQLSSYLKNQRTSTIFHRPLPIVLPNIVAKYAATTSEEMWSDGLPTQELQLKRPQVEIDDDKKPAR
jgi:hypothetical protein